MLGINYKPKKQVWKIINIAMGFVLIVLATFYLLNQFDIIPDGAGFIGFIDDIIVLLAVSVLIHRLWTSFSSKLNKGKTKAKEFWRQNNLIDVITDRKFLTTAFILGIIYGYFIWTLDLIPDVVVGFGYLDDTIVSITMALQLIRTLWGRR